jgi:hypothetical protein
MRYLLILSNLSARKMLIINLSSIYILAINSNWLIHLNQWVFFIDGREGHMKKIDCGFMCLYPAERSKEQTFEEKYGLSFIIQGYPWVLVGR